MIVSTFHIISLSNLSDKWQNKARIFAFRHSRLNFYFSRNKMFLISCLSLFTRVRHLIGWMTESAYLIGQNFLYIFQIHNQHFENVLLVLDFLIHFRMFCFETKFDSLIDSNRVAIPQIIDVWSNRILFLT